MTTSIHPQGGVNSPSQTLISNGNTVLAASRYHIARFNDDGSLDTSYGNSGVTDYLDFDSTEDGGGGSGIYSLTPSQDGGVYAVGQYYEKPIVGYELKYQGPGIGFVEVPIYSYNYDWMVYKLDADGFIDTSYGDNGSVILDIGDSNLNRNYDSTISSDGGLLITGSGSGTDDSYVVKLLGDGDFDATFGVTGIARVRGLDTAYVIEVDEQDQIYVGGGMDSGGAALSKLNSDGTLDYSFGDNGYKRAGIGSSVLDIDFDYNGRVLASISKLGDPYATMRLFDNGQIDRSLNEVGVIAKGKEALYTYEDGSFLISVRGHTDYGHYIPIYYYDALYRYSEDGSLDISFGVNGVAKGGGSSVTVLDNGNIVTQSLDSLHFYTSEGIPLGDIQPESTPPSDINISETTFDENIPAGAVVASFITTDSDDGDTFSYSFVDDVDDTDNALFTIDGDQLIINESPDFETKSSYSMRLQTQDSGGLTFRKVFTFSVNDINEAPSALKISSLFFDENIADGSAVASLNTTDQDFGDTHTYSLIAGQGDGDNSAFTIDGNQLKIIGNPDFETQSSYSIRLQTTDSSGLTYAAPFKLSVNDLPEPFDRLELLEATINGDVLTLDFNKPLNSESSPSINFWIINEDGRKVGIKSIEQRATAGQILLNLEQPVDSQSVVTLSYRDLAGDQLSDVVQDSDGFDLSTINDYAVDNQTERSQTELDVLFAEVDGNKVLVAFNRELDDTSPSLAPFRFKANGRKVSIDDALLDADGRQLTLTLSRFIRFDETATLMYTDAEGDQRDGVVQDIDGNDLSSFNIDVENASPQESKLELVSGEAEDNLITLDFNEQLSGTKLSMRRFKVTVNNKKAKVDSAELFPEDGYIEVSVNKSIEFGDDVLISYKDLNGDQADDVIQDGYGSDLATFKNFAPDVTSPDEQGPILEEAYIDDGQLYLEFDELIAPGRVKGSRIKLRADGKRMKVKSTNIEDEDTVAIFDLKKQLSPITQELLLSYKDPKRDQKIGIIQDLIGNDMESVNNVFVEIVSL